MANKTQTFRGSFVALVTPFDADGAVDYALLEKLVEFHLTHGTDGLVVLGTTAETPTLTEEEKKAIAKRVIRQVAGRIPVILGAGSNNTLHAAETARSYEALGADGLLVVTPYYNKANKSGMLAHFETIAAATSLPIILYNVPGRTGCSIPLDVLETLSHRENIVGIKEASGDIGYATRCARLVNENFSLFSGNDDMILPILSLGGSGVISVLANIAPRQTHELVASFLSGDTARSRRLQLDLLPLIEGLFLETNPVPVKKAMELLGWPVGPCRLPLGPMSESNIETLRRRLELLK
ncbi:4-hydroxy-tetrahydrodipicolinate synthase [Acidaminobacterium chupaoyuni]